MSRPLLPFLALAAAVPGQDPAPGHLVPLAAEFEYLRPFRAPEQNLQPPLELYEHLRAMQGLARTHPDKVRIDDEGREVCDVAAWHEERKLATVKSERMGGYLAVVARDSGSPADRRTAFYGSYYLLDPQHTIAIMALIPGEPLREIRMENLTRALAFLRVHLPKQRGGEAAARAASPVDYAEGRANCGRVYERPEDSLYIFEPAPFCALVESGDVADQAQALWFLREVVGIHPPIGVETLGTLRKLLPSRLCHDNAELRSEARSYLAAVDPEQRPMPAGSADQAEVDRWLAAVLHTVFPPIRRVSAGLVDLYYPSEELDDIAATGSDLLARDAIGGTASGTVGGVYYRGFRLTRLPEPLDRLGIPVDAVITHVNGAPVSDGSSLRDLVTDLVGKRRELMIDYVHANQRKAIQFRFRRDDG